MAVNLIEHVKDYLTSDVIQKAASYIGESDSTTQRAMGSIVPTVIGALANQASTPSGAQQLRGMLDAGKYDGSVLTSLSSLFSGGATTQNAMAGGRSVLEALFGDKATSVSELIARFVGMRTGSASTLLTLAVPLVMHVLGKHNAAMGPSSAGLATLLGEQKSLVSGLLPGGLVGLLGWVGIAPPAASAPRTSREPGRGPVMEPAYAGAGGTSTWAWLLPLLILGGVVLAGLGWLSPWRSSPPANVQEDATAALVRQTARLTNVDLPSGVKISVPEGSFNHSLSGWLAGTDATLSRRFVFDNLNFETGTTRLTPESTAAVESLVTILKAYPAATVLLEGYTDSTGDAAANKKLSLERANAVKTLVLRGGIAEARIGTEGLGQENPIAANDTEEGRAKNRRLEAVVQRK
jgi:OmpA-OmpF porin, OOP family